MVVLSTIIALLLMHDQSSFDGITYADNPSTLWVTLNALRDGVGLETEVKKGSLVFEKSSVPLRKLYGVSDWAVRLSDLRNVGFGVKWDQEKRNAGVTYGDWAMVVNLRPKKVLVSIEDQELQAYQGTTLVLRTPVSTGRNDWTPRGLFSAQAKYRMHYSSLFDNAPMPFSVQVSGNVFLHGYHEVPAYPASHGCVRIPLPAAATLFDWIELRVPIHIF
jgi:hypothetical protein